ncbi:beta-amylase 3, chloroplastic [Neltuma alba]|uniref:beta-amylase 3, chloroplastic-like n=1 Tax=Neltuma alba TaxID=207710 RepID=UPI0010A56667|nr:beta-amylase 3, chloroplastic-like [Prosopis alba]XP_028790484.1 beta-amylase 3, chloroplastic-like [Prosopis alba]
MAIASHSTPSFSPSFCSTRTQITRFSRFPSVTLSQSRSNQTRSLTRRLISSRLNSSKFSDADGFVSPGNGDSPYELQHDFSPQRQRRGSPVYVTLPLDAVGPEGRVLRPKTMTVSFRALASAGVEGVVLEIWWGLVERNEPMVYNWNGYWQLVKLAGTCGLKVRVVLAFHQCGTDPADRNWIPLPLWVIDEIKKDPGLVYSDRFGTISTEYISLGCDTLPVLCGRSPIQAYADFMRNFRDAFRPYFGIIITGIQIGMGPGGELRYPLSPSQLIHARHTEFGEFQCYDKYMIASLNACARDIGMHAWGQGAPHGTGSFRHNLFTTSEYSPWNTPQGKFFLEWYSGMLLLHGERICREAETIFRGTEVSMSAKVAAIHWHYLTDSHPSELTAGYYNTSERDGYLPIALMFSKYGFGICCSCFEMQDAVENKRNPVGSPEGFLRQLVLAARLCDIQLEGQNFSSNFNDMAFEQVLKMSKLYTQGVEKRPFSFNFVRMGGKMFESRFWDRFTRFVRQMSDGKILRARLNSVGDVRLKSLTRAAEVGLYY